MYVIRLPEVIPAQGGARSGFMRTAEGRDAREFFIDFIRDPAVVENSAADADRILTQWSAQLLKNHPWLRPQIAHWLRDGAPDSP
jgi:hypothetical protein